MSIFLEDEDLGKDIKQSTDTKPEETDVKTEEEEIAEVEDKVSDDANEVKEACGKFKEAVAYQEAAWSNIIISTMQEEYKLLKEEEDSKEASKGFFRKIIDWCKTLFEKIKGAINTAVNKLTVMANNCIGHYKKNGNIGSLSDIPENYKEKKIVFKYATNNGSEEGLDSINDLCEKVKKWTESGESVDGLKVESKEYTYEEALKEGGIITKAETNLKDGMTVIKNAKKYINGLSTDLKNTESSAKKGESATDDNTINECKEEVKKNKTETTRRNHAISVLISVGTSILANSMKVYNAALKCQKKNNKAVKKATTVEEKPAEEQNN
jgi:hypothetical protein